MVWRYKIRSLFCLEINASFDYVNYWTSISYWIILVFFLQSCDDDKKRRRVERRHCNVLVSWSHMFSEDLCYCTHGAISSVVMLVSHGCVAHVFKHYNFAKTCLGLVPCRITFPLKKKNTNCCYCFKLDVIIGKKKNWMTNFGLSVPHLWNKDIKFSQFFLYCLCHVSLPIWKGY